MLGSAAAAAVLLCAHAPTLAAQASPWLYGGHWTRDVATRLHALGATPLGFDPSARVQTVSRMHAAFLGCDEAGFTPACTQRLTTEHPQRARLWYELAGTYALHDGAVLAGGFTRDRVWTGPRMLEDVHAGGARLRLSAVPTGRVAVSASVEALSDDVRVEQAVAEVRVGAAGIWGGRRMVGYAAGLDGGFVLSGVVPVDGAGVRIAEPVQLAWLGAFSADVFAGVADSSGLVARPWLLGMRLHAQPHARFDIGATRAAVFGGIDGARVGVRQVAEIFVGANPRGEYADDQVASVDARWRAPLPGLALELYGEWALHDIDLEVLIDMPAFTLGARFPTLPGTAHLALTLEHTQISGACCGNPPWYHHFELADGWTESGVLRGHPLAGHGREWRASLHAALADWRVLARADAFTRTRGAENLLAPDRTGRAHGALLTLDAVLARQTGVRLFVAHERGADWRETHATLSLHWHR